MFCCSLTTSFQHIAVSSLRDEYASFISQILTSIGYFSIYYIYKIISFFGTLLYTLSHLLIDSKITQIMLSYFDNISFFIKLKSTLNTKLQKALRFGLFSKYKDESWKLFYFFTSENSSFQYVGLFGTN